MPSIVSNEQVETDPTVYFSKSLTGYTFHSVNTCGRLTPAGALSAPWPTLAVAQRRPCHYCRPNATVAEITRYCLAPMPDETPEEIVAFWSAIRQKCGLDAIEWDAAASRACVVE